MFERKVTGEFVGSVSTTVGLAPASTHNGAAVGSVAMPSAMLDRQVEPAAPTATERDGPATYAITCSILASPTALYRHRRRLYIGIAEGSVPASPRTQYQHR